MKCKHVFDQDIGQGTFCVKCGIKSLYIDTPSGVVEVKPTDKRYNYFKKLYA